MNTGISCFKQCGASVIGQCRGYGDQCGQFYCNEHSADKLCIDCARKLLDAVALAETQQLYIHLAEETYKIDPTKASGCALTCFGLFTVILIGIVYIGFTIPMYGAMDDLNKRATYGAIAFLILIGILTLFLPDAQKRHVARVSLLDSKNPGFTSFYQEFKKAKKQQANENMIGTASAMFLVGGAAYMAVQDYKVRQDIHTIAKSVDKYR